ncbi:hypothetical protein GALL_291620 [mine drainage metagenome]|uniref:Uncharacterized protein n=1 Tax=mine drainage metagenome TaxID=410659 RepID=A0A1J5RH46_9ZZZZ
MTRVDRVVRGHRITVERDDRAGPGEHRDRREVAVQVDLTVAVVDEVGQQVDPGARGQPRGDATEQGAAVGRLGDRCDDELAAEQELVRHLVGLLTLRPPVVQRQDQGRPRRGTMVHGVQVRHQPVPQPEELRHDTRGLRGERPRLLGRELVRARVQPQHGRERAELEPPGRELVVLGPEEVPADVVAPPAVADVARRRGEQRLERERRPRDHGVAGEPDGIAVAARARVPREGQGPTAVAGAVEEVEVVEHPQRVDAGDA